MMDVVGAVLVGSGVGDAGPAKTLLASAVRQILSNRFWRFCGPTSPNEHLSKISEHLHTIDRLTIPGAGVPDQDI